MASDRTQDRILCADWLLPVASPPIHQGGVVINGGKILAFGKGEELCRRYPKLPREDFPEGVLLPGLVNAHTHLELSLFKGRMTLPNDFISWVFELIGRKIGLTDSDLENSARRGLRETLTAGTTTVGDITNSPRGLSVLQESGCRSVLFREVLGRTGEETALWVEKVAGELHAMEARAGEKTTIGLSPHTPHTLSEERLKALAAYLRETPIPYAMHIAESEAERDYFRSHAGALKSRLFPAVGWGNTPDPEAFCTPFEHVRRMGLLSDRLVVIHGVYLTAKDLDLIQGAGARVVLCPRSNHLLRVGTAPVREMLERGIPVGLGTDSLASNTTLSLWDEMRFLQERYRKDELITTETLLRMGTLDGAVALGLDEKIGSIEEGKEADLIVVECRGENPEEIVARLIEQTTPDKIRRVMVAGKSLPTQ